MAQGLEENTMAAVPSSINEISQIAERGTKDIRHMDVITHDPESQRIKAIITRACWEAYELAAPKNTETVHVTTRENVAFVIHGLEPEQMTETWKGQPADQVFSGKCAVCQLVHDPRQPYDHPATAPKARKKKHEA